MNSTIPTSRRIDGDLTKLRQSICGRPARQHDAVEHGTDETSVGWLSLP